MVAATRSGVWGLISLIVVVGGLPASAAVGPDFHREIEPILVSRCVSCHGPEKREGGLRLTGAEQLRIRNDSGEPAVVPSQSGQSELIRRVTASEASGERMPPEGSPLSPEEIARLKAWIDAGAEWPASGESGPLHWAYVKPTPPQRPPVSDPGWCRNEIDRFVLARLETEGLPPSPAADPGRLLRRVYLDLIGLPPELERVDSFLADPSPEHYERIVDELLASPRYGEKWARQWLDLSRYADSNGYQADQFREIWAYRDWVIQAMNDDLPYDRFTVEQIAGDLLPHATASQRIATGFHRCTTCNVEAGVDPEENRINQIIDRVNTTGTVWLGTTLECAQCHNHKYDPFTQEDYYRLFAFFNNTPLEVGQGSRGGVQYEVAGPKLSMPLAEPLQQKLEGLKARLVEVAAKAAARQKELEASQADWERELTAEIGATPQWHVLRGVAFESDGGSGGELLEDGSLLITGRAPDQETYTLQVDTELTGITGFKLECLTHPSLSKGGPGRPRTDRPNFVVNALEISIAPIRRDEGDGGAGSQRLTLHTPQASYSNPGFHVAGLIDDDLKTGWAIHSEFGKDHWASVLTSGPVGFPGGSRLTFRLPQRHGGAKTIGRLRVSVLTGDPGIEALPEAIQKILGTPAGKRTKAQQRQLTTYQAEQDPVLSHLQSQERNLQRQIESIEPPTTLVMVEMEEPRMTQIFKRGDFLQPLAAVEPLTPAILPALPELPQGRERYDRLALAEWLVSEENPLTARVAVNRWWAEFFGRGLVATLEDFGTQGERPSHPELLDWLALELVARDWSMKRLHKLIVLSATYQQDSRVDAHLLEADPYNALLTRGPRLRLPAETIRDQALAVSGLLSTKMGGPPVYPPQPADVWRHVGRNAPKYETDEDEDRFRRGIYVVYRRSAPYPSFVNFDAPDRGACCVQRSRTNTPLQALTLLNDPAYVEMAFALGRRIALVEAGSERERVERGFQMVVSRRPSTVEVDRLLELFENSRDRFRNDPRAAAEVAPERERLEGVPVADLAAWFYLANLLLNLDETVTKG